MIKTISYKWQSLLINTTITILDNMNTTTNREPTSSKTNSKDPKNGNQTSKTPTLPETTTLEFLQLERQNGIIGICTLNTLTPLMITFTSPMQSPVSPLDLPMPTMSPRLVRSNAMIFNYDLYHKT